MARQTRDEVLAQRLRECRELRGLSQDRVADELGLKHRVQVSNFETGRRCVQALELLDLCRIYGVPVTRMTEGL